MFQEIGPFVMNEVDHETFDMTPILILIGHDHQFAVAKFGQVTFVHVLLAVVETENLDEL